MGTFGAGKKTAWKERKKVIAKAGEEKREFDKSIASLAGIEKLKFDILKLEKSIKSSKYDLEHNFPDNGAIINKIKTMEINMNEKVDELKKLEEENGNQKQAV